jgi:hypothetical protein
MKKKLFFFYQIPFLILVFFSQCTHSHFTYHLEQYVCPIMPLSVKSCKVKVYDSLLTFQYQNIDQNEL